MTGRTGRAVGIGVTAGLLLAGAGASGALLAGPGPSGAAAGASSAVGGCGGASPRLTVGGTGVVTTTPDLLTLSLDVSTTGQSAGAALTDDDSATAAVLAALASGGVASKDVQTTDLSIQPTYGSTGGAITGYSVDDTVVAKIRQLSSAGSVVDAAVTAGGDAVRIDSLVFSVTNPNHVQDRARQLAVRQAVRHASSMARAAGERLGPICSAKDETSATSTGPVPYPVFAPARGAANAPAVPVQPGTQQVTDRVSLVYSLTSAR